MVENVEYYKEKEDVIFLLNHYREKILSFSRNYIFNFLLALHSSCSHRESLLFSTFHICWGIQKCEQGKAERFIEMNVIEIWNVCCRDNQKNFPSLLDKGRRRKRKIFHYKYFYNVLNSTCLFVNFDCCHLSLLSYFFEIFNIIQPIDFSLLYFPYFLQISKVCELVINLQQTVQNLVSEVRSYLSR